MDTKNQSPQRVLWLAALAIAPVLLALSQFYCANGVVTITAGVLMGLAFFAWIFVFQALFSLIKEEMPVYAVFGFAVAVFGCIAGNNFGIEGIYLDAMGVHGIPAMREVQDRIGTATLAYLFIPGLCFPLSLLVLGINLWRKRKVDAITGALLCLAAVCFPLGRIPRIEWLMYLDNFLLLVALLPVARLFWRTAAGRPETDKKPTVQLS
jgi:hypothetical protein